MTPGRRLAFFMAIIMIASIFGFKGISESEGKDGSFEGGDGSSTNPYKIEDVWDLQNMSSDLNAHYILTNDIDASITSGWNSGKGFAPIGSIANKFTGSLDGKGYNISELHINRVTTDYVGLLGYLDKGSSVLNLSLIRQNVIGHDYVGGFVGYTYMETTVEKCSATGSTSGNDYIGGIVGYNWGIVRDCYTTGSTNGNEYVGGVVGNNKQGTVKSCSATGITTGVTFIGGLMGYNDDGTVNTCSATGNTIGSGSSIGGLVGMNEDGIVENSNSSGSTSGSGNDIGSLVGSNYVWSSIKNCYSTGNSSGYNNVGGLVGYNYYYSSVMDCYASGTASGSGSGVGGLIGNDFYSKTVRNCYATGSVICSGNGIGGLVGCTSAKNFINSYYNIDSSLINSDHLVTPYGLFDDQYNDWFSNGLSLMISDYTSSLSPNGSYYEISTIQGLKDILGFAEETHYEFRLVSDLDMSSLPGLYIPYLNSKSFDGMGHTISNLYIDQSFNSGLGMFGWLPTGITVSNLNLNNSNITGLNNVGGLAGGSYATITNCSVNGFIRGNEKIGALIGRSGGIVTNCHSAVTTIGTGQYVGGLIGDNIGDVSYCHTSGSTRGNGHVGGLLGYSCDTVSKCNATGTTISTDYGLGGLVGFNVGTIINCFASGTTMGNSGIGGLVGMNSKTITNCFSTGTTSGTGENIGGLVGSNSDTVTDCYTNCTTSGTSNIGGLVGLNNFNSIIKNCYATGATSGSGDYIGGLVGRRYEGTITCSFWDKDTTGQVSSDGGEGMTKIEMKSIMTYTRVGWDIVDVLHHQSEVWYIDDWYDYPRLGWEVYTDRHPPTAEAGSDKTIGEGTTISFNGRESSDNYLISNYTWTFKDEVPITLYGDKPDYQFNNPGIFNVTLNVSDAVGNWNVDTMTVTVIDITSPIADAGLDQVVDEGTNVEFDGRGSYDNVGIVNYTWTFIDIQPVTLHGLQPEYIFSNPGAFLITLKVTDSAGCWDTDEMTIIVRDITPPDAITGPDRIIDKKTLVTLSGDNSSDNIGIVSYKWTFIDGSPIVLNGIQVEYQFNNPGTFIITLNVTDAAGNWATAIMTVTFIDIISPFANAGSDQIVDERTIVTFDGSCSTDNVGIVNYTWTFTDGDPITLYGSQVEYHFEYPGVFIVTLNVTDAISLWNTDTITITVQDTTPPVGYAGPDQTMPLGSTIVLNGSSSTDNGIISRYTWSFTYNGEEKNLEGKIVNFKFDVAGEYQIILSVYDNADNYDDDKVLITIVDKGIIKGTVLDTDGNPIEGAVIEIIDSNGEIYTVATISNGSFSVEIYHGPFTWTVSMEGYKTISGTGSVDAMEEIDLDLSDHPLEKEDDDEKSLIPILIIVVIVILIMAGAGIGVFLYMKSKGKQDSTELKSEESKPEETIGSDLEGQDTEEKTSLDQIFGPT